MERDSHTLLVPVAAGELVDKITILRLKSKRLQRPEALANVIRELKVLETVLEKSELQMQNHSLKALCNELQAINTQLWDVEDSLRVLEKEQRFDNEFIAFARSVYHLNDQRASLKREINQTCGSALVEEKSYGELPDTTAKTDG